jgi:RNA polymerase sigma-70 factor (ECF subfamily)
MLVDHTPNGVSFAVIRRAQRGDLSAFGNLVQQCRRRTMGVVRRMISCKEDTEDVAQEVFFRMHTSLGRLRQPAAFDFWLYRLTLNAAYDYLRRRPLRPDVLMAEMEERELNDAAASASWQVLRDEQDRRRTIEYVDSLLANLSPMDRVLIVMREVEGLTMQEMGAVLGVTVGAAKLRLFRARIRLRRILNPRTGKAAPLTGEAVLASTTGDNHGAHCRDWIRACKGGTPACSNFSIAGPYTEWLVLSAVATHYDGKLLWDNTKMEFTNNKDATKWIKPVFRKGWQPKL